MNDNEACVLIVAMALLAIIIIRAMTFFERMCSVSDDSPPDIEKDFSEGDCR